MTAGLAAPPCCRSCGKPRERRPGRPGYKGAGDFCGACYSRWHRAGCPPEGPPPPLSAAGRAARSNAVKREAKGPATVKISLAAMPLPARGACWGIDTGLFFPPGPGSPADPAALAACASCQVRTECLEYATETRQHGVWGGTTEDERAALRDREQREQRNAKRRVGSGRDGVAA